MAIQHRSKHKYLPAIMLILVATSCLVGFLLTVKLFIKGTLKSLHPPPPNVLQVLAQAPCVAGVCPGMADRSAILAMLSQNSLIARSNDAGTATIHYKVQEEGHGAVVFEQDTYGQFDVVQYISFGWSFSEVILNTIMDISGQPDALFLMFGCGRGEHVQARLFYSQAGIEVDVQYPVARQEIRNQDMLVSLDQNTLVLGVVYFDPTRYDEWLLEIRDDLQFSSYFDIPPSITVDTIVSAVQPWPGLNQPVKALDLCPR